MIQIIQQRLKQILQRGPFAGLDHHIGGHPRLQPTLAKTFELLVRYRDMHQIKGLAGGRSSIPV